MKKDKAHFIAFVGVMFALIFVLFMLEGALQFGFGMTALILTLPLSIALSIYDDWKKSFLGGTLLGCVSCVFCLIFASMFILYANPLISVLPRMFIGITAYWSYFGLSKLCKNAKSKFAREVLPAAIAGAVGAITNTALYLLSIFVWKDWLGDSAYGTLSNIVAVLTIVYFCVEIVACIILVPVYVKVLKKVNRTLIHKPLKDANLTENSTENINDNMS